MIDRKDLFQIGKIQKPHGLQGMLAFSFSTDVFEEADAPCLICEVDGIFVPFFVEELRFKNEETALVKFEGIDNDKSAKILLKCPLYIERKYLPQDLSGADVEGAAYYEGFQIIDECGSPIGEIVQIDDSTENYLFLVENEDGEEFYIPAVDDYIIAIDDDKRVIQMELPEGLLTMNQE